MYLRWPSANGCVKLGHPVPLSNLVPPWNSGRPHRRQVNTPGRFSLRNTPQKGASVPCSSNTWRSSSLRSATSASICSRVGGVRSKFAWWVATSCGIIVSFIAAILFLDRSGEQSAALRLCEQLFRDVRGDSEANPDIARARLALARAEQRAVDADDLALEIDQGAARIAGIDRRVGLDEAARIILRKRPV